MLATLLGVGPALLLLACTGPSFAQTLPPVRGAYTPGMNATNSGVMPEPGLSYANLFVYESFDEFKSNTGSVFFEQGNAAVLVDMSIFEWVTKKKIFGANFAAIAILPVANSDITSVRLGAVGGGGGFANSYFQPFTLGWHLKRLDIQPGYGFVAPTGRFTPGATNNVGSGFWTNALNAGETLYLKKNKATSLSAYQYYEFHTTQRGTNIHPGQCFDLDYSLMQILPLKKDEKVLLQFGLVGYGMWQTTNNSGPGVNPADPGHYKVNSFGGAANVILPKRKASVGFKYFKEFWNVSTVQGYSLQIVGAITF
jgi:hypothetical protein